VYFVLEILVAIFLFLISFPHFVIVLDLLCGSL